MIKPKHIGQRLLIRKPSQQNPDEITVIEVSPDERYFKCQYLNGSIGWKPVNGIIVASELPPITGGDEVYEITDGIIVEPELPATRELNTPIS